MVVKVASLSILTIFLLLTALVGYFSLPFEAVGNSVEASFLLTAKRLERALVGVGVGAALLLIFDTFFRRRFASKT